MPPGGRIIPERRQEPADVVPRLRPKSSPHMLARAMDNLRLQLRFGFFHNKLNVRTGLLVQIAKQPHQQNSQREWAEA